MIERRRIFLLLAILAGTLLWLPFVQHAGASPSPPRLAFLGLRLQNDNEVLEPTTDAERTRIAMIEKQFTSSLEASQSYSLVPLTDKIRERIANGQFVGACGGCEADFGKELGADRVAWITVQKVSNLILNMNLYIADPATAKLTFLKSVDIRGNTDESWSRSLKYLLDNYFYDKKS
jgi:hypothetical protein